VLRCVESRPGGGQRCRRAPAVPDSEAHPGLDEHRDRRQSLACGHGALWVLRHFFAIALLPFTVAVLIPIWLARRNAVTLVAGSGLTQVSCRSQDVAS